MLTGTWKAELHMEVKPAISTGALSMPINWLQPTMGMMFVAIWLIIGQIIVRDTG